MKIGSPDFDITEELPPHLRPAFSSFKAGLNKCQYLEDFVDLAGLGDDMKSQKDVDHSWKKVVVRSAVEYFSQLRSRPDLRSRLQQVARFLYRTEKDIQLFAFAQLAKIITPSHVSDRNQPLTKEYGSILEDFVFLLPKQTKGLTVCRPQSALERAFFQHPYEREVVMPLYREMLESYELSKRHGCQSPYASIAGPSGIGKSYVVSQFARQGLVYVIYVNLAGREANRYPNRSFMASVFDSAAHSLDDEMATFELFFAMSLVLVSLSREMGITPAGLFDAQVREEYQRSQKSVASLVQKYQFEVYREHLMKTGFCETPLKPDYQGYINRHLKQIREEAREVLVALYEELELSDDGYRYIASEKADLEVKPGEPSAVICLDEARQLTNHRRNYPEERFLSFFEALKNHIEMTKISEGRDVLALFLDTLPILSYFSSCGDDWIPSPIYRIGTMNMLPDNKMSISPVQIHPDGATKKPRVTIDPGKLFSQGRPLWQSLIRRGSNGLGDAALIAKKVKRFGELPSSTVLLALWSYRMDFEVILPSLAEELVSKFMRSIINYDIEHNFLRTMQPSEPILAWVAADYMHRSGADMRLEMVENLYESATEGLIKIADFGETVAAIILLLSFDKAHVQFKNDSQRKALYGGFPLTVIRFLRDLLPRSTLIDMKDRMQSDEKTTSLWGGYVFFNHMVKVREMPSESTLRDAFNRGAAILLPRGQIEANILIPILLPDDDEMTYFIIQVSNEKEDHLTRMKGFEAQTSLQRAAGYLPDVRVHLAMAMRLGSTKEGMDVVYPTRSNVPKSSYHWDSTKRVVLLSSGVTLNLFPGLGLTEEPAKDPAEVKIVKVLKEMLKDNPKMVSSYHQRLKPLG